MLRMSVSDFVLMAMMIRIRRFAYVAAGSPPLFVLRFRFSPRSSQDLPARGVLRILKKSRTLKVV
jgi:hypothetical protein